MNKVDISVIIPVYNREAYIAKCIDSVLKQNTIAIEVIIIDDGSTDNSLEICNNYAAAHSNILVIHQENKGMASARNVALNVARGEYITFLDSDDCMGQGALFEMLTALKAHNVDAVIGEYDLIDEEGNKVGKGTFPDSIKSCVISQKDFWMLNSNKETNLLFTVVWGKLFKKRVWESLRFGDGVRFAEDEFILGELVERCNSFYLLAKTVYIQTSSHESLTRSAFNKDKLTSPESKLKISQYLLDKKLYSCAVEKWGIAAGEIILMTKLAGDKETRDKLKTLDRYLRYLGNKLFIHMDISKKVKYIAYCIGYPFYAIKYRNK